MTDMDRPDALSETLLRNALRLEADERPPRFDAIALAAAAERRSPVERLRRVLRGIALIGLSLGLEAAVALVAFNTLSDHDLTGVTGVGLSLLAAAAERAVAIGERTSEPTVAIAALAAVLFAIVHERNFGREPLHARAS